MEDRSFLSKFLFLLIIFGILLVTIFYFINRNKMDNNIDTIEKITSFNVDTKDLDLYIYKIENNKLVTSENWYSNYYLSNNAVDFLEYGFNSDTKFYLKVLSNTINDLDNISVSYEKIDLEHFNFLLNNNSLLKVYLWLDNNDMCKSVLLYSENNEGLVIENY